MPEQDTSIPLTCKLISNGKYRGWVEMPRFPLVDAHTYWDTKSEHGDDGQPIEMPMSVTLDRRQLERIASTCNKRIADTGDFATISVGHTKDDLPTKFQPRICGLARDFSVEPFLNELTGDPVLDESGQPKLAIYATPFCQPSELQTFLDHPRRSIELHFHDGVIDPIALLSSEMPARDLGLHKFSHLEAKSKYQGKPYRFSISEKSEQKTPEPKMADEIKDKPIEEPKADSKPEAKSDAPKVDDKFASVFEDARWKKMESFMQDIEPIITELKSLLQGEGDEHGGDPSGQGAGADLGGYSQDGALGIQGDDQHDDLLGPSTPDDLHGGATDASDKTPKDEPHKAAYGCAPDRMSAASAPGGMNTFVPSANKGPNRMSASNQINESAVKQIVDTQTAARFSKIEQENAALKAQLDEVRGREQLAIVTSLLTGLGAEGCEFDAEKEASDFVRMSAEDREKRMDYIRKYHRKSIPTAHTPGAGRFPVPTEQQAVVRLSKGNAPQATPADEFNSQEEAVECAREAAMNNKTPKEVLLAKRGLNSPKGVTQVR